MALQDFQERRRARRILLSWPVLVLSVFLAGFALWGVAKNIVKYLEIRTNVAETERKIAEYEASRMAFEERLRALETQEGLEKEARERFNLKKPGEEVVIFSDSDIPPKVAGFKARLASILDGIKNYIKSYF